MQNIMDYIAQAVDAYLNNIGAIASFFSGHISPSTFLHQFNFKICAALIAFILFYSLCQAFRLQFFTENVNESTDSRLSNILAPVIELIIVFFPYFFVMWERIITTPIMLISGDSMIGAGSIIGLIIDVLSIIIIIAVAIMAASNTDTNTDVAKKLGGSQ